MRILRLDLRDDRGTLDLHPFVSIVRGLDDMQIEDLVSAVRGLVRGSATGLGGLVESDGELVELGVADASLVGPLTTEDIYVPLERLDTNTVDPTVVHAELDQLTRHATIDAILVEETRADLDPSAAARVQRIQQALQQGEGSPELDARIAAVHAAGHTAAAVPFTLTETPVEIEELIAKWNEYDALRAEHQPMIDQLGAGVEQLLGEREVAMRHVADAEAQAIPVTLTPEQDRRVEEIALNDGGGRRGRSQDDEAELASLLSIVGQETYVAYAMYRMAPQPSRESVAAVEGAKLNLAKVETALEHARLELKDGPVAQELKQRLELVKADARVHLGPMLPSDLGAALRTMVVEVPNPEFLPACQTLYDELVRQHVVVPDDLEPRDLPQFALQWAAEAQKPLDETGRTRAQLKVQLVGASKELDRHARAMARIDRLETTAEASRERVLELRRQLEAANGIGPANSAEQAVGLLRPLADRVRSEAGASVPLVLKGDFDDLDDQGVRDLLGELEVLAQDLQLVIVTERVVAEEWAADVGLRRALGSTISPTIV